MSLAHVLFRKAALLNHQRGTPTHMTAISPKAVSCRIKESWIYKAEKPGCGHSATRAYSLSVFSSSEGGTSAGHCLLAQGTQPTPAFAILVGAAWAFKPVPKPRLCRESTALFGCTERMVSTCTTCNEGLTASISQEH